MKTRLFVLFFLCSAARLAGQWIHEGQSLNDTLDRNSYFYPRMEADGHGGAYVAWEDNSRIPAHVYVQRVSREGRRLWGPNGMQLSLQDTIRNTDQLGVLLSRCDESRFVYATWYDPPYVRVQKLDSAGRRYWSPDGLIINPRRTGTFPVIASDGSAGIFVASIDLDLIDEASGERRYLPWIQRIDSSGRLLWGDSCVVVARNSTHRVSGVLVMGSSVPGQAYLGWIDKMGNPSYKGWNQFFIQRFDHSGRALWVKTGVPVTEHMTWDRHMPALIDDGRGGLFVFWRSFLGYSHQEEVQHLDSTGMRLAGSDGRQLFEGYSCSDVLSDGRGGFFIYFMLGKYGYYYKEVQHYDGDLITKHWKNNKNSNHPGIEVVDYILGTRRDVPEFINNSVAPDGAGGLFVAGPGEDFKDTWVQWIDSSGRARWMGGPYPFVTDSAYLLGKTIRREMQGHRQHTVIRATAPGEAFIVWIDSYLGPRHVYLAKVTTKEGVVSVQPLTVPYDAFFTLRYAYPQPTSGDAHVAGDVTRAGMLTVSVYDLTGREVVRVFDGWRDPGSFELPVRLEGVASGSYYIRARMGVQESVIPIVVTGRR